VPSPLPTADIASRSRGRVRDTHIVMTPPNLVPNRLPEFVDVVVKVLATPRRLPAAFGQYLLEFGEQGRTVRPAGRDFENFVFVLDGAAMLTVDGTEHTLRPESFAYVPDGTGFELAATPESRVLWLKRHYESAEDVPAPQVLVSHVDDVELIVDEIEGISLKKLLPDVPSFDMAMNIVMFEPGAYFPLVEIHHQEHGLYMLRGQGIYQLGDELLEVCAEDYIYMAPYCPQYFYATGWSPSAYLLYKDVNRDGF